MDENSKNSLLGNMFRKLADQIDMSEEYLSRLEKRIDEKLAERARRGGEYLSDLGRRIDEKYGEAAEKCEDYLKDLGERFDEKIGEQAEECGDRFSDLDRRIEEKAEKAGDFLSDLGRRLSAKLEKIFTPEEAAPGTDRRMMDTCAIVGANWGDEGKGRMVDLVAEDYDVVVRYQGGNNAGHTIKNDCGTFALNLLPSGIFRYEKMNVLGSGMVVDIRHLCGEIEKLRQAGVRIDPGNLMISDRAIIVMPYHVALDGLEEARLSDKPYGSTKRGIAPVYGDKYMKKGIMMGELFDEEYLKAHLRDVLEFKNLQIKGVYGGEEFRYEDMLEYLETYGKPLLPYIGDTGAYLRKAAKEGRSILYEAQLGALRDIDFGIYPYTSSSSPLAAYAPIGSGTPDIPVNRVIGIVKAYSSCVGEGPFTCEWFGEKAEELREAGGEYGAATGRPRRVGPIDIPATRYGVRMQGATEIALTKLDVLSYMKEIPICIDYEIDGERTGEFPFPARLAKAKPVEITMPGWNCDISGVRCFEDLPEAARNYVEFIEKQLEVHISYVSVGAEREAIILR